jgi:hypothetical protein
VRITRITSSAILAAALCLAAANAWRAEAGKSVAAEENKPPAIVEMEKLHYFVGSWSIADKYEKTDWTPNGGEGAGTFDFKLGPGGYSLIGDLATHTVLGDEIGHGILTWEPKENAYKEYVAGNTFPGCFITTGHWEKENLVFTGQFNIAGADVSFRDVFSDMKPASFTIHEYFSTAGNPERLLYTSKLTRK